MSYIDKNYLSAQFTNFAKKISDVFSKVGHKHTKSDITDFPTVLGTVTGVKINGSTKSPSNGIVDLGTVITSHQDISEKYDKSGGNITGDVSIGTTSGTSNRFLKLQRLDNDNNLSKAMLHLRKLSADNTMATTWELVISSNETGTTGNSGGSSELSVGSISIKEDGTIAINGNVLEPRCNIVPDSNATYYLGGKEKVFLETRTRKVRSDGNLSLYSLSNAYATFIHSQDLRVTSYSSSETTNSITYANVYAKAFNQSSSIRYKENVKPMTEENALKLLQYNPVTFDYINKENGTNINGFIAEEMACIDPTHVEFIQYDNGEILCEGIDYSSFTPQIIKLLQMHNKYISDLENKISDLEEKVNNLQIK